MTDKPILFSGPMVRALLDGRKTQTRRVLKPQPPTSEQFRGSVFGMCPSVADGVTMYSQNDYKRLPKHPTRWDLLGSVGVARDAGFPLSYDARFAVGDRLWVREKGNWTLCDKVGGGNFGFTFYAADSERGRSEFFKDRNRPAIHMPRWASRLTLEVTGVKVERVRDISEDDAEAEGIRSVPGYADIPDPRDAFELLWDAINEYRGFGWDANPWVVAVTFTVHQRNIDQLAKLAA